MSTSYFYLKKQFCVAIYHTRFDVEFVEHPYFKNYMQAAAWATSMVQSGKLPVNTSAVELYIGE